MTIIKSLCALVVVVALAGCSVEEKEVTVQVPNLLNPNSETKVLTDEELKKQNGQSEVEIIEVTESVDKENAK